MTPFSWEVALGGQLLEETELHQLLSQRSPLVDYHGEWVLLDPLEIEKLPRKEAIRGQLAGPEVLEALLTGHHQQVPIVANEHLIQLVAQLQHPLERAVPSALNAELRGYQKSGYYWLCTLGQLGLGACLADDMGLGKTIQLITYLLHRVQHQRDRPTLIVCPTSIIRNWTRELQRFAPSLVVSSYHGLERDLHLYEKPDVVITTYGLLVRDAEQLAEVQWDVVVLDEAQAIKNPSSRRSAAAGP